MSGLAHSVILSRPSETHVFELVRQDVNVTKKIVDSPSSAFFRSVSFGINIEPSFIELFNPTTASADVELTWVTPDGNFTFDLSPISGGGSSLFALPVLLEAGEFLTATIRATSTPGARVNLFATYTDVNGVSRTRTVLTNDWLDILPQPKPGAINCNVSGTVFSGAVGATVEYRLVTNGEPLDVAKITLGPNTYQFIPGLSIRQGQRHQARLTAGSAVQVMHVVSRPATQPVQTSA